ncbi:MAG: DUF507 family protein [Myxococcales bacterium]|nr:DUF507 family protein [Myxococcales bacterium]MDD9966607.1 DUF507 family protein [Myxococcales bacterium]
MRLYRGKIEIIADEIISTLTQAGDIEVADAAEAKLDIEAVLKEYLRLDREVLDEAKNRMEVRGLGYGNLGRVKSQVAKERGAPQHDDVLPYLLEQILNILFHSHNIDEIYAEDVVLRKKLTPLLRKHMEVDSELDREVRSKIKNLQEGTSDFEVEYGRVMGQLKDKYNLS